MPCKGTDAAKRVALILIAALGAAPALAQQVGTAAAVNPASTGKPPGRGPRILTLGTEVVHNERIQTNASGSVQLLFVDKTAMSIGPNSDVTIDEYVFDPDTNSGKMAVTVGKGVMRFVGGQVSHSGEAIVTTPSASIGIRGGTGIFDASGPVINLYGRQTIRIRNGGQISLYRPGAFVDAGRGGASTPGFASARMLAAYNSNFEAKPRQIGGRRTRLSESLVNAKLTAHNVNGSISPQSAYDAPTTCHDPRAPSYMQICTTFQTTTQAMQQAAQSSAAMATAGQLAMPRPPTGPGPSHDHR